MKNIVIIGVIVVAVVLGYMNASLKDKNQESSELALLTSPEVIKPVEELSLPHSNLLKDQLEDNLNQDNVAISIKENKSICIDNDNIDDGCLIDTSLDLEARLFNKNTSNANLDLLAELLKSSNFLDASAHLSSLKTSDEAHNRESKFNNQINEFINTNATTIQTEGVFCGDEVCTASFTYESIDEWNDFYQNNFHDNEKGSMFINNKNDEQALSRTVKIVFLPNSKGVIAKAVDLNINNG